MAIDFVDPGNQHIDCGVNPGSAAELSLSWWMIPHKLDYMIPLDKNPEFGTAGWTIKMRLNGDILFRIGSNDDNNKVRGVLVYSAGVPVHIACTFGSGTAKIYADGALSGTLTGVPQTPNDIVTAFRIGQASVVAASELFDGWIGDVRVYNRVLVTNEVTTIYTRRGADGIVHGLVSRWKMLEGYPTQVVSGAGVVKDRSSGYDGTPANSPTWVESIAGRRKRRAS